MRLQKLCERINGKQFFGNLEVEVRSVGDDSRKVEKGGVFVAIKGARFDGHSKIEDVYRAGGVGAIGERKIDELGRVVGEAIKAKKFGYVRVKNSREALSIVAQAWHGYPADKLKLIGITGTDGKTTTADMTFQILREAGKKVGMITTVEARIGERSVATGLHVTSPEPLELQGLLGQMVRAGMEYAVIEVTSHAIDQGRIYGIEFEIAAMTNVTQEHLDYHGSFENYLATKTKLFGRCKIAIVNLDDQSAGRFIKAAGGAKIVKYGVTEREGKKYKLTVPGEYNLQNYLAAAAVCGELGISENIIRKCARKVRLPEGRLSEIKNSLGLRVIVDFAHTPNAVEKVLSAVKGQGKVICVVSAEGERDPRKRAAIVMTALKQADLVIANPIDTRSEDPEKILEQMKKGAKGQERRFAGFIDRREAIEQALIRAWPGETVLITGKGHEKSMAIGKKELPWSDKEVTEEILDKINDFHFMGIGGSGMSAAAILAVKHRFWVSGCDSQGETAYLGKVRRYVKKIKHGHGRSHLSKFTTLVTSPAVLYLNKDHPEVVGARRKMTWQEFVGSYLHRGKKVVAISGTHGKSTTTAMAGLMFEAAGRDSEVLVGAKVKDWGGNFRDGKGEEFIIEADEFYDNFLNYKPETIVLNNIEFDHPDYFKSYAQLERSFEKHIRSLRKRRNLIVNADDIGVANLLRKMKLEGIAVIGYTIGKPKIKFERMLKGKIIEASESGDEFKVAGETYKLRLPGEYNVSNAMGVIALAGIYGIEMGVVKKVLAGFGGVGRRLEKVYEGKPIVYDDYAHHPTAIKATLGGLRQKHPKSRILAIIEPHSFSRTKKLLKNYKGVFESCNRVIVGPVFRARDKSDFGVSGQDIADTVGEKALYLNEVAKIYNYVGKNRGKYEVVVIMGAGMSYEWAKEIKRLIER